MTLQTIKKSIGINAPKEKVWTVLIQEPYNLDWYDEFSPGTRAESDWKPDSRVLFKDSKGNGMVAWIESFIPHSLLSLRYEGGINEGVEDYTSEMAKDMKGGHEIYRLSGVNGKTILSIESDMMEEYFDMMSKAWDLALEKIKAISEKI